jgi:hypothetical protein
MATPVHITTFIQRVRKKIEEREHSRLATSLQAGHMSAADKAKLDSITFDFERGTLTVVNNGTSLTFTAVKEDSP